MKMIKGNKYLNFCAIVFCLAMSNVVTHKAFAQWALPTGDFNLTDDLKGAAENLTNWALEFIIMISVLVLIWGGINYVFSSGDTQKADLSKKIIYYALIGLFIGGIAYAIVKVIVERILI